MNVGTRLEIVLKLPLSAVRKLNQIADKRGDTFREAALTAFLEAKGDEYLASLPDLDEDDPDAFIPRRS